MRSSRSFGALFPPCDPAAREPPTRVARPAAPRTGERPCTCPLSAGEAVATTPIAPNPARANACAAPIDPAVTPPAPDDPAAPAPICRSLSLPTIPLDVPYPEPEGRPSEDPPSEPNASGSTKRGAGIGATTSTGTSSPDVGTSTDVPSAFKGCGLTCMDCGGSNGQEGVPGTHGPGPPSGPARTGRTQTAANAAARARPRSVFIGTPISNKEDD